MKKKNTTKKAIISLLLITALIITGVFAFLTSKDSKDNVFTMGKVKIELHEDEWYDAAGNLRYDKKVINKSLTELETELTTDGYSVEWDGSKKLVATKDDDVLSYVEEVGANGDTVYESNGINDFAENALPDQKIPKAPYIKNVGKNDTYAYINISIPVVEVCVENSNEITEEEIYIPLREDGTEGVNDGWELVFANKGKIVDEQKYNVYVYAYSEEIAPEEQTPPLFSDVKIVNFTNATTPIFEYTSRLYSSEFKDLVNFDNNSLFISPIISANAYSPGQYLSEKNVDEKNIIGINEEYLQQLGDTDELNMLNVFNGFVSLPTVVADERDNTPFDFTTLYRIGGTLTPEELIHSTIYVQANILFKQYVAFNPSIETKLSNIVEIPGLNDVFNSITLKQNTMSIPFDDGFVYNRTLSVDDLMNDVEYTTSFENHKNNIINGLGTDKIDLSFMGYSLSVDKNFYDALYSVYNNYEDVLTEGSTYYDIFEMLHMAVDQGKIPNNKRDMGNFFLKLARDNINNNIHHILFYNIREDITIDGTTYPAGLYLPWYGGNDGISDTDYCEPSGFLQYMLLPDTLDPIIVTSTLVGYNTYTGNFDNINMNVTGYGIQASADDTPVKGYYKGMAEQDWEEKTVNITFIDPETNNFSQQLLRKGDTLVLPETDAETYWFSNGENYDGGTSFVIDSYDDMTFIKAFRDTNRYLTFSKADDGDYAKLESCSPYVVGVVSIPQNVTIDGVSYPVQASDREMFVHCPYLYGVTIPSSISTFGNSAGLMGLPDRRPMFDSCPMLSFINFENNLTAASDVSSFITNCNNIEEIVLPDSSTTSSISTSGAVSKCENLKTLTISRGDSSVVTDCPRLTTVYYNGTSSSYYPIIRNCFGLNDQGEYEGIKLYLKRNTSLPGSSSGAGGMTPKCPFLNTTPDMIARYKELTGDITATSLIMNDCCYISEVHCDNTIAEFQTYAAGGFSDLTSPKNDVQNLSAGGVIEFPTPIKLFVKDNNNTEYFVQGNYVVTTDNSSLHNYAYINELTIEEGVTRGNFSGCKNINKVNMNSSVCQYLNLQNTSQNSAANQFIIGDNVSALGSTNSYNDGCMYGFKVDTIHVPASVTTLNRRAFNNANINNIIFDTTTTGLQTINEYAFEGCSAQTVTIPATVTTLENYSFANSKISNILFDADCSITSLPQYAFYDSELRNIVWPTGLTTIKRYAFSYCDNLSLAILPTTLTTIEDYAFSNTNNLSIMWIPNSCVNIGAYIKNDANSSANSFKFCIEGPEAGASWSFNWNYRNSYGSTWPVEYSVSSVNAESLDGNNFIYADTEKTKLIKCLTDNSVVVLPSSITEIANNAFIDQDIVTVIVPTSVEALQDNSFNDVINIAYTGSIEDTLGNNWGASYKNAFDDGGALYTDNAKTDLIMVYRLNENNSFDIPETVINILSEAFVLNSDVKNNLNNIIIPPSVVSIGERAFQGSKLKNISFTEESSLASIGAYSFNNCSFLNNMVLPEGLTEIPAHAFDGCVKFTEINIPESVLTVGEYAYYNVISVINISEITIPDSVQTIGAMAFATSNTVPPTNLTVNIGKGLISSSPTAFQCKYYIDSSRRTLEYGPCWSVLNFNAEQMTNTIIENSYFLNSRTYYTTSVNKYSINAKTINIGPDVRKIPNNFIRRTNTLSVSTNTPIVNFADSCTVTEIGEYAFYNSGLATINIPRSVVSIQQYAFSNCLSSIIFEENASLTTIGPYAFYYSKFSTFDIPYGVETIGNCAFYGCSLLNSCSIPNSVISIGERAFYSDSKLSWLTVPTSVETIGNNAFYNVSVVEYHGIATGSPWGALSYNPVVENGITYSDSTKTKIIKASEASGDVVIPSTVTTISGTAFAGNTNITSLSLPMATSVSGMFKDCTSLQSVTFTSSASQQMGQEWFSGCTSLETVTLSQGLTSIGENSFANCSSLSSITIPNNVTNIKNSAFSGCTALSSVVIPNSVTSVGSNVFKDCTSLSSVILPSSIYSYPSTGLFSSCPNLTSFGSIGSGCDIEYPIGQRVPSYILKDSHVSSVQLPATLLYIDSYAFSGCSQLTEISFPASLRQIGQNAFEDCSLLTSLYIPTKTSQIGANAFKNCSALTSLIFEGTAYTFASPGIISGCSQLQTAGPIGSGYDIEYAWTTSIPAYAFQNSSISSVVIPETATSIGEYAFASSQLVEIDIPDTITTIGNHAFDNTNLSSVFIPASTVNFGPDSTFSGCSALTSVGPVGRGCDIEYGWTTAIPAYVFKNSSVSSVIFADTVTSIGAHAFASAKLVEVNIPDTVTTVGNSAFYSNTPLTTLTLGKGITSLGEETFSFCTNLHIINYNILTNITIPNDANKNPFYNISASSSTNSVLTFGEGVTSIPAYLFAFAPRNTYFNKIYCTSPITSVGTRAFWSLSYGPTLWVPTGTSLTPFYAAGLNGCGVVQY